MSKRTTVPVPTMTFGSGRSGQLRLSVGKRGRVTLKGDASFNPSEARVFLQQMGWFLDQVSMAGPAGGSVNKPTKDLGLSQLDLFPHRHAGSVPSVAEPATVK